MQTWDAIRARRNVRAFSDRPLDPADVDRVLEAGRLAPSAKNRQAWDFVLVTDRDQLAELATVWQGAWFIPGSRAAVVLTVPDPEEERYLVIDRFDLGQATMAMMLAATDLGIGTGHASVHDQEALRRIIGMPEGHTGVALIGLGYPADRPLGPPVTLNRRPFDEVVHRGTW
jgi:nitroreductase